MILPPRYVIRTRIEVSPVGFIHRISGSCAKEQSNALLQEDARRIDIRKLVWPCPI